MLRFLRRAALATAIAALAACATTPSTAPIDRSTVDAEIARGDYAGAATDFERMADADRAHRDELGIEAAELRLLLDDVATASRLTAKLKRKKLSDAYATRLDLVAARIAHEKGDDENALSLSSVMPDTLLLPWRENLLSMRASALTRQGRLVDAGREQLARVQLYDKGHRGERENELVALLAQLDANRLNEQLASLPADDGLRPYIERALRKLGAAAVRDTSTGTREAGTWLPSSGGGRVREGYSTASRVALILPLSGDLAAAGRAVRDGYFAAYFADDADRPAVRVFDSASSGDGARAAYQQAIAGAERVVGPLGRVEVQALLEGNGPTVPLFALNQPDQGLALDRGSAAFALTPDEEAALASDRARDRSLLRAGVIVSTEEWGERAALSFRAQYEHAGGHVIGDARLPATGVDFGAAIKQAIGDGVDVLFVALRPAQARLLLPQLRTRGYTGLPVFATSHIYGGSSNRAADRDLNGVEFCDSPWLFGLAAGMPQRADLMRALPAAGNNARLFAFGMDAYRLSPYAAWLQRHTDAFVSGASGQLSVDAFGRVRRNPAWMVFDDGLARAYDGGLAADAASPPAK
jgi:outer membrane PBP1 activator LpoA protein